MTISKNLKIKITNYQLKEVYDFKKYHSCLLSDYYNPVNVFGSITLAWVTISCFISSLSKLNKNLKKKFFIKIYCKKFLNFQTFLLYKNMFLELILLQHFMEQNKMEFYQYFNLRNKHTCIL